jgi:hypothetical protein
VRLREARAEARLFLESPERLGHLKELEFGPEPPSDFERTDDLLPELRRAVFRSRRGECLTRKALGELYDPASALLPTQAQLAHVVGCADCLEDVNRLLGRAPLSERNPADSADREQRVTSETSELDLVIDTNEPLGFVEILSEQDVSAAYAPADGPARGRRRTVGRRDLERRPPSRNLTALPQPLARPASPPRTRAPG